MDPIMTTWTRYTTRISCEIVNSSSGINAWILQQIKFTPHRLNWLAAAGTFTRLFIFQLEAQTGQQTRTCRTMRIQWDSKVTTAAAAPTSPRITEDVPTGISHIQTRAHLGIRLGLFKAQRLIYSRRGGGGGGLTCAVLSFAFALAALRIRPPSLQQQRQQAGGHQAPDDPAGTPAMPRRAWQHREEADPTCRRQRDAALGCRFRWKAQLNPGCSRRRLAHTVPHWRRAQRGEGGGMCG